MGNKISYQHEGSSKRFIIFKNNNVTEINESRKDQFYKLFDQIPEEIALKYSQKKEQLLSMGNKTIIEILWLDLLGFHNEIINQDITILPKYDNFDNILDFVKIYQNNYNIQFIMSNLSEALTIADQIIKTEGCSNMVEPVVI